MHLPSKTLVVTVVLTGCGAAPETPPISEVPEPQVELVADVVYGHKFGMALTMDVYRPSQPNGAGVIFLNSGSYVSPTVAFRVEEEGRYRLASDSELGPSRQFSPRRLLEDGFTFFDVRHGSSPKFVIPEAVDDVRRAIRFVRERSAEYGVAPSRLGVWGGSAGGHLALLLGLAPEVPPEGADPARTTDGGVAAIVAYFAPVDIELSLATISRLTAETGRDLVDLFPAMDFPPERYEELSPLGYVTPGDPPTLILHGDQDTTVPVAHGHLMHAAVNAVGGTSEIIVVEGAGHAFLDDDANMALARTLRWFQLHLK